MAAVFVHDAVHRGKAHAASLTDVLGREERLEHALLHVGRDTGTVIRDGKLDHVAFEGLAATRAHFRHSPDDAHRHADLPARTHRIARVDGEIHQHLLELDRVEQHRWRIVVKVRLQSDRRR